jgi:hypothetical protein
MWRGLNGDERGWLVATLLVWLLIIPAVSVLLATQSPLSDQVVPVHVSSHQESAK